METPEILTETLALERIEVNTFRGVSPEDGPGRIFGGQVIAQSLLAAYETVGLYNLAVAHRGMPPSLAFEIVRAVFENHAEMMEAHAAAAATVPANFIHNTVLPWHPGAMRYYGSRAVTGVLTGD